MSRIRFVLFIVLVTLLLGSVVLAAAQEPVTLRIAWWGSDTRAQRTNEVIAMFQEKYPWITLEAEPSNWEDYWIQMEAQGGAGNLPDIVQQDYSRLQAWVTDGWQLPLDEFIEDGTIDLSDVGEASVDAGKIDGKVYAISLGSNSLGIMIDVDKFEAAEIPLPPQDWTWADFEDICLQLHEKLDEWCMGNTNLQLDINWISIWLAYGETAYTLDGTALGYSNSQPYIDFLHMILRLQDAGAIPVITPPEDEVLGMGELWSNQMIAYWAEAGEDRHFVMQHLPRPADGCCSMNYVKPSQFWTISANSEHPKEAAMFIDFFINSLEANRVLLAERGVPVSKAVQEDLMDYITEPQQEMFNFLARVEDDHSPLPPPEPKAHQGIASNVFIPMLRDPVALGEVTPEEAMELFNEEATRLLSEQ